MSKGRIEAFSDGVIAIIITIMVLELRVPEGYGWEALRPLLTVFASYVLSFAFVGIYWNNHHHVFQAVKQVGGRVLWANLLLLFWLSLIPFATSWMEESAFSALPVALYGAVLLFAALSYTLLVVFLIPLHGKDSAVARAAGPNLKGWSSVALYVLAIALAFVNPKLSVGAYVLVALMWFIPDGRIEKALSR